MDHGTARETKAQAVDYARELAEHVIRPSDLADVGTGLAIGLAPQPDGSYALAVRYRLGIPSVRSIARKVVAEVGQNVDVRRTGRISTLSEGSVCPRKRTRKGTVSGWRVITVTGTAACGAAAASCPGAPSTCRQ